ncbi:MAG: membrane protein insertase YidC [Cellvibrionaceae bacterium]
MTDWLRTGLLIGMAAIAIMLVVEWGEFQEQRRPKVETRTTLSSDGRERPGAVMDGDTPATSSETASDIPEPEDADVTSPGEELTASRRAQLVTVHTDRLEVIIDTHGGDIVKVALPQHAAELDSPEPLVMLNRNESILYIAESGLIGKNGTVQNGRRPVFSVDQTEYRLADRADSLQIDLTLQQENGVSIIKRFVFQRDSNLIGVNYLIDNQSNEVWSAQLYGQIKRDDHDPATSGGGLGMRSFLGPATTTDEDRYRKFDFEDVEEGKCKLPGDGCEMRKTGGWLAMVQHYFISAWIPDPEATHFYYFRPSSLPDTYLLGFRSPMTRVQPGEEQVISASFYAGPKDIYRLEEIAPHLERTIDYGPLWFICLPLFYFLSWIHGFVSSWAISIILLVVCVKAAFFHLSAAGFRSMAKMRKFAPRMTELKERYGDNRQKFSEEMIKLYKKEKINPMKGCLPMLLQMPVFIALYWVLMESVELRHASFLWINDLSVKDPFLILPIVYALTFWFQMKLNPPAQDPTQQKIMQMMPFIFGIMFVFFPAGLVLYWVVNGILSIAQQYYITRQIERGESKA